MTGRVLITGGLGYVGSALAEHFAKDGYEVILLAYQGNKDSEWASRYKILTGDICDSDSLAHVFRDAGPIDVVVHLAALHEVYWSHDVTKVFEVNGAGALRTAEAARNAGVRRFVYFSTFHVYGAEGTITEETVPTPSHQYGVTKLAGEHLCTGVRDMEVVILRAANGIGPPANPNAERWTLVLPDLCRQAVENHSLTLKTDGGQERDFVSLDDLYQATKLLVESPLDHQIYNVGSGHPVTIQQMAEAVRQEFEQITGERIPLKLGVKTPPAPPLNFRTDRIEKLGFTPTTDIRTEARRMLKFCMEKR